MTTEGDRTSGWPTGRHNPLLVEGRIEQAGLLAHGAKYNKRGRRRALRMLAGLVLVIAAAVSLVIVFS